MKIIEEGVVPVYRLRCGECGTLFEYERLDTKHKFLGSCYGVAIYSRSVECPKCKMNLALAEPAND